MSNSEFSSNAHIRETGRAAALSALKHAIGLAKLWAGDDEVSLLLRRTLREMKRGRAGLPSGESH